MNLYILPQKKTLSKPTFKHLYQAFLAFFPGIFLIPLIFNPSGYMPFEIPKVAFLLIFIAILLLVLAWELLFQRHTVFFYNPKLNYFLLAVTGSILLSNFLSFSPIDSFWGSYSHLQGTVYSIFILIFFLLSLQFLHHQKNGKFYLILAIISLPISLIAIGQFFHLPIPFLGATETFNFRPFSTIGNPNMLGQWLLFPIIGGFFAWRAIRQGKNQGKKSARALFLISTLLSLLALCLTQNRASLLALAVVIMIALIRRYWHKHHWKIVLLTLALIGTSGSLYISNPRSINTRSNLIASAIPYLLQTPLWGRGAETLPQTAQHFITPQFYQTENLNVNIDRLHNFPLQILHDFGWLGLALLLGLLYFIIKNADHSPEFYLLLATFISLNFSFNFSAQDVLIIFILAIFLHKKLTFKKFTLPNHWLKISLPLLALGIFIFSLNYAFRLVRTDYLLAQSDQMYFQNVEASEQIFQKALQLSPPSSFLYNRYFQLYTDLLPLSLIKQQLPAYQQNFGQTPLYHLYSAQLKFLENLPAQARDQFQKLALETPNWPLLWSAWGDLEFKINNWPASIEKYQKLEALAPTYLNTPTSNQSRIFRKNHLNFLYSMSNLGQAYAKTDQKDRAHEIYLKYLDPNLPTQ